MGWCSGTDIFDQMVSFVLSTTVSDEEKYNTIRTLARALEDSDWDCQSDSNYWDDPIVQRALKELHPDWDED